MEAEAESESESGVAWCWVIEALARSNSFSMDVNLLYELAASAQVLGDPGSASVSATEAVALRCLETLSASSTSTSPHSSNFEFDPSYTCQHVFQHILHQTANLQKDVSEELRTSVRTFVDLKKPTLPKCTLELLKDAILNASHPLASSLKEITGLVFQDQSPLNVPSNCDDPSNTLPNAHATEPSLQQLNCSATPETDVLLQQPNITTGDSSHSKKDHNDVDIPSPPRKKLVLEKQGAPEHSSVSLDGRNVLDDTQDQCNHQFGKSNENSFVEAAAVQAKASEEEHNPRIEPDTCPHPPDETDAAMSDSSIFSRTHRVVAEESIPLIDTEESLCMKCNEGGKLLACCGSTCPLMFHESCLPCSVDFGDQGNFYCPICAYSRAISEYLRVKQKVSEARKQLSLFIGRGTNHQLKNGRKRSPDDDINQRTHGERDNTAGIKNCADTVTQGFKPH